MKFYGIGKRVINPLLVAMETLLYGCIEEVIHVCTVEVEKHFATISNAINVEKHSATISNAINQQTKTDNVKTTITAAPSLNVKRKQGGNTYRWKDRERVQYVHGAQSTDGWDGLLSLLSAQGLCFMQHIHAFLVLLLQFQELKNEKKWIHFIKKSPQKADTIYFY